MNLNYNPCKIKFSSSLSLSLCFSFAEYFVFCIYSGSRTVVLAPFALTGGHVSIFHYLIYISC